MWGKKPLAGNKRVDPFARASGNLSTQSQRLRARKRARLRVLGAVMIFLVLLLLAGALWGLNQPGVRVSHVDIFGADPSLVDTATTAMQGAWLGIIPRNSIFFLPEHMIRSEILGDHPEIAAVSIFREGFTGISIKVSERVAVARWCGLAKSDPAVAEYCYVFDPNGYVFAAGDAASSTPTLNSYTLYAPLLGNTLEPLRATIGNADALPSVFDFARRLATFGSPVTTITLHEDEVDMSLTSGTRILYVRGSEENAFAALSSAATTIALSDGSIAYVDLRFPGKLYVKKNDESPK